MTVFQIILLLDGIACNNPQEIPDKQNKSIGESNASIETIDLPTDSEEELLKVLNGFFGG